MKHVFGKDGVVVSMVVVNQGGVVPSSTIAGAIEYLLPDDSPVNIGWLCSVDENGAPSFSEPPPLPPAEDPAEWLIDVGQFFDRFKDAKMDVLMSDNATVRAIVEDAKVRKWIDLQDPSVGFSISILASIIPSVTQDLKAEILTTPVAPRENLAVRKLYFS